MLVGREYIGRVDIIQEHVDNEGLVPGAEGEHLREEGILM